MSHNLQEILHIFNIISSMKINNSFDACSFIPVSQKGIAKETRQKKERGEELKDRRSRRGSIRKREEEGKGTGRGKKEGEGEKREIFICHMITLTILCLK